MAVIPFQSPRILQASPAQRLRARDAQRLARYQELWSYYDGAHYSSRRRGRTDLVVNYARAIVDKHVSYLFARGVMWDVPVEGSDATAEQRAASAELTLTRLFDEAALFRTLLQAATNASVLGDAVLKVMLGNATPPP